MACPQTTGREREREPRGPKGLPKAEMHGGQAYSLLVMGTSGVGWMEDETVLESQR